MITAQLTDVGRKRSHNEDNLGVSRFGVGHQGREVGVLVATVCDGMGGAAAGEVASGLAVRALMTSIYGSLVAQCLDLDRDFVQLRRTLHDAIGFANSTVHDEASSRPGHSGMGCTATVLLGVAGRVLFGQVGDSRGYLFRGGELRQVTLDHSFVSELLRDGRLTEEEAENHPRKSVITRAIGSRPEVEPDLFELRCHVGDVYLVCSDGLTGMVPDEEIAALLGGLPDRPDRQTLANVCRLLVDRANEAGGTDNISVVLACAEEGDVPEVPPDPPTFGALDPGRVLTWSEAVEDGHPDVSLEEILFTRRR